MASVRQIGSGKWEVRVSLGRRSDGRYEYRSRTVEATGKRVAERLAAGIEVELRAEYDAERAAADDDPAGAIETLGDALRRWFDETSPGMAPGTVSTYESHLSRHILPALGERRLDDRHLADAIQAFYRELSALGLDSSTRYRIHGTLRAGLNAAVRLGWLDASPLTRVIPPPIPRSRPKVIAPQDIDALIEEVFRSDQDLAEFVELAAVTGCRRSEIVGLRWDVIDLDAGTIRIERAVVRGRVVKATKTEDSRRTVTIPGPAVTMLVARRARAEAVARSIGAPLPRAAYVFSREPRGDVPWDPNYPTKRFRAACNRLGLHDAQLRYLRSTSVTLLLAAGESIADVAARHGHSKEVMLDRYAAHLPQNDRSAAERIGEAYYPRGRRLRIVGEDE